jgi:hypothetical protein
MQLDPRAFFFTEHYRNYPAVLIRLADVPRLLFGDVVKEAWQVVTAARAGRPRPKRTAVGGSRTSSRAKKRPLPNKPQ